MHETTDLSVVSYTYQHIMLTVLARQCSLIACVNKVRTNMLAIVNNNAIIPSSEVSLTHSLILGTAGCWIG